MEKYVIMFRFQTGTVGVAGVKDGCFALLLLEGKPGDYVVAKGVSGFPTRADAEGYLTEIAGSENGKKLLSAFEGRVEVVRGDEITIQ